MVKGHLNTDPQTAQQSADGYFKRLWYDGANGAPLYDYAEQFEKVWEAREKELENVAVLGYD